MSAADGEADLSDQVARTGQQLLTTNPFADEPMYDDDPFQATGVVTVIPVPDHLTDGLNEAQAKAVRTLDGRLVVVAGPGSGKTKVLTHRIAALLLTGSAQPRQILAVTFTNKAAGEMRERLEHLIPAEQVSGMWVATFHSACLRMLRANPAASGLPVGFNIIDSDDAKRVTRAILTELQMPNEAADAKKAHGLISAAKNAGDINLLSGSDPWLVPAANAYQARLDLMGSVDFDDILTRALAMLRTTPHVLERYRRKFRHILVDEYQDTNVIQHELLALLGDGAESFCVVGDADQSIYGWRSADPRFMLEMTKGDAAKVVVLEENYRSTPQILEVCQAIIDGNPAPVRPVLRTPNADGPPVRFITCDEDRTEVAFVVGEVIASRAASRAILMRTNAMTRGFEEQFTTRAVPYTVVGALKFYDRAEIKDALAYLRLAANPRDIVSFTRVANTPRRGFGQVAMDTVVSASTTTGTPIMDIVMAAANDGRFGPRVTRALVLMAESYELVVDATRRGPHKAIEVIIKDVGLADHWRKEADSADRIANLSELVTGARSFCESNGAVRVDGVAVAELVGIDRTIAYLENVALVGGGVDGIQDSATVQLMTVHAAKGKEFDDVWVIGVEDGLFPHHLPGERPNTPEERRLLFVACSRAARRLTLTRARKRMVFGKLMENAKSELLDSLPSSVELASEGGNGATPPWKARSSYANSGGKSWGSPVGGVTKPPSNDGPRVDPSTLAPGEVLEHPLFGKGPVEVIEGVYITVGFPSGPRMLNTTFAPLTRPS